MLFSKRKKPTPTPAMPAPELEPLEADIAVRVRNVSKRFKDHYAVRNVSFDVRKGECVALVGFNGAGKSTLLQIIAETLQPTEGDTRTQGRVVAMLELGSGFNPEYTGIENLYMNASLLGVPRKVIDDKLEEIKAFAEIGDYIDKPVKTYSTGMIVRLAFSLLTQIDPDVMIIDEALSVGDQYFSHKCARLIRKYKAAGKTFLFVSHSEHMVKSFCDRAILIEKGQLLREGKPDDVLDFYNALVAQREREAEILQVKREHGIVTRSGNGLAKIDRFEILDAQRHPRRRFKIGDAMLISCVVEARADIPAPTIGFMIRDRLGNDIHGTNTHHLKTPTSPLRAGQRVEAIFETALHLGPGDYSLTFAVHEGAEHLDNSFDWLDRPIVFQVLPPSERAFTGVAALPTTARLSGEVQAINRDYLVGDVIDFSTTGASHRYTTGGWHAPELEFRWTDGAAATVKLRPMGRSAGPLELVVRLHPFACERLPRQRLRILANGELLAEQTLSTEAELALALPAERLGDDIELVFETPDSASPADCGVNADPRALGFAFKSLQLRAANPGPE